VDQNEPHQIQQYMVILIKWRLMIWIMHGI
jgi:hypothetical protein